MVFSLLYNFYFSGLEGIPFVLNQNISMENKSIFKVKKKCGVR